jgi:replicative DNA helicase
MTDLENAIISSALINKQRAVQLTTEVSPFSFKSADAREVFSIIKNLLESGHDIDSVSILETIKTADRKNEIKNFLAMIYKTNPTVNFNQSLQMFKKNYYTEILKNHAVDIVNAVNRKDSVDEIVIKLQETFNELTKPQRETNETVSYFATLGHKKVFELLKVVKTGIKKIDETILGFIGGHLIIIAGRPGDGKSAFALQIAMNIGDKALFYGLEMDGAENYARVLSSLTEIPLNRIITDNLTKEEREYLTAVEEKLKNCHLEFVSDKRQFQEIMNDIRRKAIRKEIDCVFIDYLQLMNNTVGNNRDTQIGDMTRNLKILAKELNIPIVVLSQMSRAIEKRVGEPVLSDLRESGNIEQDANAVIFLYNCDEDKNNKMPRVDVIFAKGRNFGIGKIPMIFNKRAFTFIDVEKQEHHETVAFSSMDYIHN